TAEQPEAFIATGRMHVRRAKDGVASVHPFGAKESRALRRLQREATHRSPYVFVSERGAPLSVAGYQRMVARSGETARFVFLVHSHMLRHSCGYKLANDGQDHARDPALSRAPIDRLHGALHGIGAGSVQEVLEGLKTRRRASLSHGGILCGGSVEWATIVLPSQELTGEGCISARNTATMDRAE